MKGLGLRGMPLSQFLVELWRAFVRNQTIDMAAQLAFYATLALFPFAMLIGTVVSFLPVAGLESELQSIVQQFAPTEATALLIAAIDNVIQGGSRGIFLFGLIGTLFSASGGITALTNSLNAAYGVPETRPWWKVRLRSLLITITIAIVSVAIPILLLVGPDLISTVASWVGLSELFALVWSLLRWPVAVVLMILVLSLLYWSCPNVHPRWRLLTPGSVVAVPLWIAATLGFDAYLTRLPSFNRTYGVLGAGIALLVWLQLTGIIIIVGGEMNAVLARFSPQMPEPTGTPRTKEEKARSGAELPTPSPAT